MMPSTEEHRGNGLPQQIGGNRLPSPTRSTKQHRRVRSLLHLAKAVIKYFDMNGYIPGVSMRTRSVGQSGVSGLLV